MFGGSLEAVFWCSTRVCSSLSCIHVFGHVFSSWVELVGPSVDLDFVFYVARLWALGFSLSFGPFSVYACILCFLININIRWQKKAQHDKEDKKRKIDKP